MDRRDRRGMAEKWGVGSGGWRVTANPARNTQNSLLPTLHPSGTAPRLSPTSPSHRSERPPMPEFDRRTLGSISDEELLAHELDKALPIDDWMAVERERGRREERRRREAERSRMTPTATGTTAARPTAATEAHEDMRIQDALAQLRALLVPGETMGAYAVQRRLFALLHRRVVVCATSGRFISLSRGLLGGYMPYDVRWQDLDDASVRAGIFGATITISALQSDDLASRERAGSRVAIGGLRKV